MIGREGETGGGLGPVPGRAQDRSRQRFAQGATVDRRPAAAGIDDGSARGGDGGEGQDGEADRANECSHHRCASAEVGRTPSVAERP